MVENDKKLCSIMRHNLDKCKQAAHGGGIPHVLM